MKAVSKITKAVTTTTAPAAIIIAAAMPGTTIVYTEMLWRPYAQVAVLILVLCAHLLLL